MGLEYQCSFVRLYLFCFAFLIICIKFLVFVYYFLHFSLFVFKTLVFLGCFAALPPSFAKTDPQSDIQFSVISEEHQRKKLFTKVEVYNFR